MKGFDLEWEEDATGGHRGRFKDWPEAMTVCLIHPHPDLPEDGPVEATYLLTCAFLADDVDGMMGKLDRLKDRAQEAAHRWIYYAASRYVGYRNELDPRAREWSALLPLLFGSSRELTMGEVIRGLATLGVPECSWDSMIEEMEWQPGICTDHDGNVTWLRSGAELIAAERGRQVSEEGWSTEHDDEFNDCGELAIAARCYLQVAEMAVKVGGDAVPMPYDWPWASFWKPSADPIPNLIKAGALIAAEIDRLQRKEGA